MGTNRIELKFYLNSNKGFPKLKLIVNKKEIEIKNFKLTWFKYKTSDGTIIEIILNCISKEDGKRKTNHFFNSGEYSMLELNFERYQTEISY